MYNGYANKRVAAFVIAFTDITDMRLAIGNPRQQLLLSLLPGTICKISVKKVGTVSYNFLSNTVSEQLSRYVIAHLSAAMWYDHPCQPGWAKRSRSQVPWA